MLRSRPITSAFTWYSMMSSRMTDRGRKMVSKSKAHCCRMLQALQQTREQGIFDQLKLPAYFSSSISPSIGNQHSVHQSTQRKEEMKYDMLWHTTPSSITSTAMTKYNRCSSIFLPASLPHLEHQGRDGKDKLSSLLDRAILSNAIISLPIITKQIK